MSEPTNVANVERGVEIAFESRGMTLKALTYGLKTRPPILALHGWMDNAASFETLAPLLDQFYVIALDLPGHGQSDHRPIGTSYFHADYALDVVHAANALKLDTFVLMGHSMGGGVATLVAAAVPERVEHLILLDGLGPYTREVRGTSKQLGKAIAHSVRPVGAPRRFASFDELLARRSVASSDVNPDVLKFIVKRNALRVEHEGEIFWQWTTDPRLKLTSPIGLTTEAVLYVLGDIKAPVLNLIATTGMMSEHPEMEQRRAKLKHAKTIEMDGHHHFHLDGQSKQTAALVSDFIASTDAYRHEPQ